MVSTICSSKANMPSVNPTSSTNKPAEEEPPVIFDSMKITQDDDMFNLNVTTIKEDVNENVNKDYKKIVYQQNILINPRTTKAEHVAKLPEVRVHDKARAELTTNQATLIAKVNSCQLDHQLQYQNQILPRRL